ncbi:MAG: helix-turn-helix domain-containing protein [Lentisphaerae bacterium]|nr:helix-turn-helix domain-containing protein [Lentisphaerota bacterium]
MTAKRTRPCDALDRIFHEPNRLCVVSALCAAGDGLVFTELRHLTALTDGNLSRHLKALEEAGIVKITKAFVRGKPQTTIRVTSDGMRQFASYLETLEKVLVSARQAVARDAASGLARPRLNRA